MAATDTEWKQLQALAESYDGHLTTKQIEAAGIPRGHLKQYVDAGRLVRIRQGNYILPDCVADEYALLQTQCSHAIFSHGAALYLWGMSDRVPHILDLTVPQGTNVSHIKRNTAGVRFHYDKRELHSVGKTETQSPQENAIILYDKERCICDLIRSRKKTDMQLYMQAIKEYFAGAPNTRKLLKYAKQFGIEELVRTYMEVLL